MLLLQQKRRQKSHHGIVRTIKKHALGQPFIHNRPRRNFQIDPLNKSSPAHFLGNRALLCNDLQLLLQVRANFIHILQKFFFFQDREKLQRNPASQRTTTKRRPMLPWRNRRSKFFLRNEGPQRQSRRNRLGNRHNIRSHAKTLERKHRPRAAEPALNLVKDQRRPVPVGRRPALLQKLHRAFINSAFAKNRLQHNRASVVVHRRAQAFDIVLRDERHFFEHRLKSFAMLLLPGQRQRPKRPPVIRALKRYQPRLPLPAGAMPRQPRQLDRPFNRLSPAVRKKRSGISKRAAQERAQLLRQRPLILVVIKVGDVNQLRRLLPNRLHNPRMRMPQRIHPQPRNKVEIAPVVQVVKKHALPPRQHNRITVISPQQIPLLKFCDLFKSFHRKIRFYRIARPSKTPRRSGFSVTQSRIVEHPEILICRSAGRWLYYFLLRSDGVPMHRYLNRRLQLAPKKRLQNKAVMLSPLRAVHG